MLLFLSSALTVQGQGISYQAVARNASGQLMANEAINVEFIVLADSSLEVYRESHSTTTNAYALFSLTIGKGTTSDDFLAIDWGAVDHFLQVKVDGSDMGTNQLETVPYSKVATHMQISQLTDVNIGTVAVDDVLKWNGSEWVAGADQLGDPDVTNEIQTLSLNGSDLSLSNGGGTVSLPLDTGIWKNSGNNIYYDGGRVGIGTAAPTNPLNLVTNGTATVGFRFENTNIGSDNDMLEIITQTGAPDNAQFLELQRGSTVEARINTDGSAEFLSLTVEEELDASTTPVTGKVYANSLPIAYGYIGSTGTLLKEYGITSVSNPTTGVYVITLNKNVVGLPVIIANAVGASPSDEIVVIDPIQGTTNQIEINISDGSGTGISSAFTFVVFGEL